MKENYTAEIAKRLKALRSAKRISQEKMAELLDITYSTYVKIERADQNITMKHLINLCKILDVTSDTLVFGNMDKTDTFNFDDFLAYSEAFDEENIKNFIDVAERLLKLKKTKTTDKK